MWQNSILSEAEVVEKFRTLRDDPHGLSTNAQIVHWFDDQCNVYHRVPTDDAKLHMTRYAEGYEAEKAREQHLQAAQ